MSGSLRSLEGNTNIKVALGLAGDSVAQPAGALYLTSLHVAALPESSQMSPLTSSHGYHLNPLGPNLSTLPTIRLPEPLDVELEPHHDPGTL